jgi:hypothetical protein
MKNIAVQMWEDSYCLNLTYFFSAANITLEVKLKIALIFTFQHA